MGQETPDFLIPILYMDTCSEKTLNKKGPKLSKDERQCFDAFNGYLWMFGR